MKSSLIVAMIMSVLLGACSGVSTASPPEADPFVLAEAEATTGPDTAMVISATRPDTGEQTGEIRWEVLEYRIVLRNESDKTLTRLETRLVPSESIRDLYGGNDPFAESSGLRGHYGKWPEFFEVTPGEEVEIIRGIITYAHETDVAHNVGSPLTREEAGRLLEVASQVTLEVEWDGGSQQFDLEGLVLLHPSPIGTADSETDDIPVFQINRSGGFAAWGHAAAMVPLVTLWADGRLVFVEPGEQYELDQAVIREANLDPATVEGLLKEAEVLFNLGDRYSAFSFTDLGYTTFSVETAAGRKTVMVYGLSLELSSEWRDREQHQDVMDRLRRLFQRVVEALPPDPPALQTSEVTVIAQPYAPGHQGQPQPDQAEIDSEWPPDLVGHLTREKAAQAAELLPPGPLEPFLIDGKPHRITVIPVLPIISLPSPLWPEDGFPRHPAATAYHLRHGSSSGLETQYRFGGVDAEDVATWYREAMSERGWELVKEADGLQVWVRQEYHNDPILHLHFHPDHFTIDRLHTQSPEGVPQHPRGVLGACDGPWCQLVRGASEAEARAWFSEYLGYLDWKEVWSQTYRREDRVLRLEFRETKAGTEVSAQEAGIQDWDWPPAPGGPGHSEPQLVPSPGDDVANLAAHPDVASVLIGRVAGKVKEETVPLKDGGNLKSGHYGTWLVKVERYLVDPLPYAKAKLRFVQGFVHQNGSPVPPRIPVSLEPGQRAVFFLSRSVGNYDPPVENDVFTTPLGVGPDLPMGIRTIENDKVRNIVHGDIQEETLESFTKRISSVALKAGRAAPMSSPR